MALITLKSCLWQQEIVVEKSRFIAYATRVDDARSAQNFVKQVQHPDATHHCYAWVTPNAQKFSDNGEPQGTAGLPILKAIQQQGLTNVAVVVVRYFGGVKLGTGGLARAYAQAATAVLQAANKVCLRLCQEIEIIEPYEFGRTLEDFGKKYGRILGRCFQLGAQYILGIPNEVFPQFIAALTAALHHAPHIVEQNEHLVPFAL